jgi:hypothetical protein
MRNNDRSKIYSDHAAENYGKNNSPSPLTDAKAFVDRKLSADSGSSSSHGADVKVGAAEYLGKHLTDLLAQAPNTDKKTATSRAATTPSWCSSGSENDSRLRWYLRCPEFHPLKSVLREHILSVG